MRKEFEKFLNSSWGLEFWLACPPKPGGRKWGNKMIFRSKKSGVRGLLDFIKKYKRRHREVVIFDKIVGQGAALLASYLEAKAVYGKTGSRLAARILKRFKIKFYFQKTVTNILNKEKTDFCPLEKLSFSKTPKEFYDYLEK